MFEPEVVRANECLSYRRSGGIMEISFDFFSTEEFCVFSLESPHEAILMNTYIYHFQYKHKHLLIYPKSGAMRFLPRDSRTSSTQPW